MKLKTIKTKRSTNSAKERIRSLYRASLILLLAAFVPILTATAQDPYFSTTISQNGELIIGQSDWTSVTLGTGSLKLNEPYGVAIDGEHGKMYVADYKNNRVLRFNYPLTGNQPAAEMVFGQPDYSSNYPNQSIWSSPFPTQNSLYGPVGVAIDANGNLWVNDLMNKRILRYPNAWQITSTNPPADVVLGATTFTTQGAFFPYQLTFDDAGNLWVAGGYSNQVYKYAPAQQVSGTVTATTRFGLAGGVAGTFQSALQTPIGVCMIGTSLFVSDYDNHRILRFDDAANKPDYANADAVLGQTDFTSNQLGCDAFKMHYPYHLTTDGNGNLYVSDANNNRVLIFNDAVNLPNGANATGLLGQPDYTTNAALTVQNSIFGPSGIAFDPVFNKLLVTNRLSARVVQYGSADNSLVFDGLDDYVNCGTSFNQTTFTISMWVKPGDTQVEYANILDNNHQANINWNVQQDGTTTNKYNFLGTSFELPANVWSHVALICNDLGTSASAYVNGILMSSGDYAFTYDGNQTLGIGAWMLDGTRNWNGTMENLSIWDRALSETEINSIMLTTLKGTESGLVANYDFNIGNSGLANTGLTTLYSKTQSPSNGTLINFALSGNTSNFVETGAFIDPILVSTVTTKEDLTIDWICGGGPDSYLLTVSTDPLLRTTLSGYDKKDVGSVNTYTITGLSKGRTYYFNLWPVKNGVEQSEMGINKATTKAYETAGNALSFDGVGNYVSCGNDASLNFTTAFTLEAWINPNITDKDQIIMSKSNAAASNGYILYLSSGGILRFNTYGAGSQYYAGTIPSIEADMWQHVAVVWDGNNKASFYRNGVFIETITLASGSGIISSSDNFLIGTYAYSNYAVFDGKIDEVRAWNKARSEKEIRQTMDKTLSGSEPNLAGYWNFDEGSGNAVLDLTSNANHGSIGAFRVASDADVTTPGNALSFDGIFDKVTMIDELIDTISNNFTVEFWVNPKETHEIDAEATVGVTGVTGQKFVNFPTYLNVDAAGMGVSVGINGISVYEHAPDYMPCLLSWAGTVSGWTHVAVVYTNNQPALYVNGTWVKTGLTSPKTNVHPSVGLGNHSYGGFKGELDEFRVWNSSLTATEIADNKNTSFVGDESGLATYYNFNETAGDTILNLSADANHGIINAHAVRSTSSAPLIPANLQIPGIVTLDGVGNYISVSNKGDDRLLTQTFSVTLWVKPAAEQQVNAVIVDASHGNGNTYSNWVMGQDGSNTNSYFFYTAENSTWNFTDKFTLPADEWSFVVITRDGDSKQKKVYVNGVLKTTKTGVADITLDNPGLLLGKTYNYGREWKGSMDDFGFYDRTLTLNEIKALYMSNQQYDGNCQSIYIPFDEDAGMTSADYSANNYPAVLVGSVERNPASTPINMGMTIPGLLKVSKGYYNTKVALEWRVDNSYRNVINKWYVYRKEYGKQDSLLIYSSAEGDNVVLFNDENADGGILYEYSLVGETDWGGCALVTNSISGVGYRSPTGVVNGKITYEGGSALANARVIVTRTDGEVGKSAYFDGTAKALVANSQEIMPNEQITVELFAKPADVTNDATLVHKDGSYKLHYSAADKNLHFEIITEEQTYDLSVSEVLAIDTFTQVTAVYTGTKMYLYINGVANDSLDATGAIVTSESGLLMGEGFIGHLDEVRMWNYGKDSLTVNRDYFRILSGGEKGCIGYWRFDEGVGPWSFDQARVSSTYFSNDVVFDGVVWSDDIPTSKQLGLVGITNESGDYTIINIGYRGSGENFTLTPYYGIHKFDPSQTGVYIGDGAIVLNNQDFTDVSAFKVTGKVRYKDTDCYASGIYLQIDDEMVLKRGKPVQTGSDGSFEIDVPIGLHSIQLWHPDHTFEIGVWPVDSSLHNFQGELSGIEFIDNTLYTIVGRVVGGPVEAAKAPGLGKSVNNIGVATLRFQSEQGNGCYTTEVTTDPKTGEYMVQLPPQRYIISDLLGGTSPVHNNPSIVFPSFEVLDLSNTLPELTSEDSVMVETIANITIDHAAAEATVKIPGEPDSVIPVVIEDDKCLITIWEKDFLIELTDGEFTTVKRVVDTEITYKTVKYHSELNFIHRSAMKIDVTDATTGDPLVGEPALYFFNEETKEDDEFDLAANPFAYPIFVSGIRYKTKISVFENYENFDPDAIVANDRVAVNDATLIINNDLSQNPNVEIRLHKGDTVYTFVGGAPNVAADINKPEYSFTKKFSVKSTTPNGAVAEWKPLSTGDKLYRGYLFGSKFINGTDFVTRGPQIVTNILRDPPGSSSFAAISAGSTIGYATSMDLNSSMGIETGLNVSLGPDFTVGFGFMTDVDVTIDFELGLETTTQMGTNNELVTTITTSEDIATSGDMVGPDADLYMGKSTNFYFGVANRLQLIPESYSTDPNLLNTGEPNNGFVIGVRRTLLSAPGTDNTQFIYTGNHIKNAIIPNLVALRNQELQTNPNYELIFTDASDPRFGANNDALIWGDARINTDPYVVNAEEDLTQNDFNGPSYIFKPGVLPVDQRPDVLEDKVREFNQQIRLWQQAIEQNERGKANAKLIRNVSFSAGADYTFTEETSTSESVTYNIESEFNMNTKVSLGGEAAGIGVTGYVGMSFGLTIGGSQSYSKETTNSYSFTLSDGDEGDYFSVDILDPEDGTSPAFRVKGGRSMCPWEGEVVAEYYQDNKGEYPVLSTATLQRENPTISVDNNVVYNVPETNEAVFTLTFGNESGSNEAMTYVFNVDDISNPDGANIRMDDNVFTIPAGQSIQKTLFISMGKPDVYDYENIKLIVASPCDDNIYDEVDVSVHFIPACTNVDMKLPYDLFTVNNDYLNQNGEYLLTTMITGYDANRADLKRIQLQYKPAGSSQWRGLQNWWKEEADIPTGKTDLLLEGAELPYSWNVSGLIDGDYNIRAMSYCTTSENYSMPIKGLFDRVNPTPFGSPQPADGVLEPNDELMILFNETLQSGMLTKSNFDIRGVLNGGSLSNDASVYFDGNGSHVRTPQGINIQAKSFTIEFWARPAQSGEQTLITQGSDPQQALFIGFNSNNQFTTRLGAATITTSNVFEVDNTWHHYAVVYDREAGTAYLYIDGNKEAEADFTPDYQGMGMIFVGKSSFDNSTSFKGNMHELRIWYKARSQSDLIDNYYTAMSGNETGLGACWVMNEAVGKLTQDKVHNRNATVNADWMVEPAGKSIVLDDATQLVQIPGNNLKFNKEQDFTIEFWFKGANQTNACLFSNGLSSDSTTGFEIVTDETGKLVMRNNNLNFVLANASLLDNMWHHLAVVVSRKGNTLAFVDGQLTANTTGGQWTKFENSNLWLGARGYYDQEAGAIVNDMHFNGNVDELRIWKMTRKQEQIERTLNIRQDNETPGLVAYYPFENYVVDANGNAELVPSLRNMLNESEVAELLNGADYSADAPPVKLSQSVQKVNFEFVVNDDKIVFIITDAPASIENCILDITVQNVHDVNGNKQQSPASWSAFVSLNQMSWAEDAINIEKEVFKPYSFTATISNEGGTQQNYAIDNLPQWLTASPQDGVLDPLSSQIITFTINEGLNTGYYSQDLYLHTDFGFDEKLPLSLRVYAPEPEWIADPSQYQYSMNIIGMVKINGVLSNDKFDKIAAFINDECRGVTYVKYIENYDMYQVYLDIYSNEATGEQVELKIWDASAGQVYTKVKPEYSFVTNAVYGKPSNPVILMATDTLERSIELANGWNWISFNLESDMLQNSQSIFESLTPTEGNLIKGISGFDMYGNATGWFGTLTGANSFDVSQMYKLQISPEQTLTYLGKPTASDTEISLNEGWNWVGYIPQNNMLVADALSNFGAVDGDIVKSQTAFAMYDQSMGWVGSLEYMRPGEGYMILSANPLNFTYPARGMFKKTVLDTPLRPLSNKILKSKSGVDWTVNAANYQYNMTVTGTVRIDNTASVDGDDVVGAFVGEECRGITQLMYNEATGKYYALLLIYSNAEEAEKVSFKIYDASSEDVITATDSLNFKIDNAVGTFSQPFVFNAYTTTGVDGFDALEAGISTFPNPFTDKLHINYRNISSTLSVQLINVKGQVVFATQFEPTPQNMQTLNLEEIQSGVYFLRIANDQTLEMIKVVKE